MDDDEIDADLIRRIGARDFRAMDRLFDRHTATLYPIAARILRDRSEAEDVVQDSWLQLWRDATAYDARRGTVEAWLRSMVRSRALDRAAALAARRRPASPADSEEAASEALEDESTTAPLTSASPALKGRVMATIQAGGAESALERSRAAERALIAAAQPPAVEALLHAAEARATEPPPDPLEALRSAAAHAAVPAPAHATPPADAGPHYPRPREAEPEPLPPHEHEAPAREPRRGLGWLGAVGWGLAVILAIVAGTLLESTGRLRSIITARNGELNELHRKAATEEKWAAILGFPGARVVAFEPNLEAPTAIEGRAVYAATAQRALLVLEDASAPEGNDYEVWIVRRGGPVSQGIVTPDSRGIAVVRLENFGDAGTVTAIAISLEPKGGSPTRSAPSGPFVLVGSLTD